MPTRRKPATEPTPEPEIVGDFDSLAADAAVFTESNNGDGDSDLSESKPYGPSDDDRLDERAPKPVGKRTPATDLITLAWGGMGTALVATGTDIPVGRVLQFQAPLAGNRIDNLIAGTLFDRWIQPLVRQADKVEGLGAIIMFPLLVGAYERNPTMAPMLEGLLTMVVRQNLVDLAPVLRKQRTEERKAASAIRDMNDVLGLDTDADPVQAVLQSIFAMPEPEPEEGE